MSLKLDGPEVIISNFPEKQLFRNEKSIRSTFNYLDIPIKNLIINDSCFVVRM
jgi:hypothetical protein